MSTYFSEELTKYQFYNNLDKKIGFDTFIYKFFGIFFLSIIITGELMDTFLQTKDKDTFFILSMVIPLMYVSYTYYRWQNLLKYQKDIQFKDVELYSFLSHYFKSSASDGQLDYKVDMYYKIISAQHIQKEVKKLSNHPEKDEQMKILLSCINNKSVTINSQHILNIIKP